MSSVLLTFVPGPESEAALTFALEEADRRGISLLVLASEAALATDPPPEGGSRPLVERLQGAGVSVDVRAVHRGDDPADVVLDALDTGRVDLVVMGIRRRTPVGKILLGSTSLRVVMDSPVPVVLVKPEGFVPPPRP